MSKPKFKPKYNLIGKPKNTLLVFVSKTYEQVKKFKSINQDNIVVVRTTTIIDCLMNTKPKKYYQVWYKII